jgi:hypothetical protein
MERLRSENWNVLRSVAAWRRGERQIFMAERQVDRMPFRTFADSELKPAGIPINYRPPFRFEAGHDSNQLSAGFRL